MAANQPLPNVDTTAYHAPMHTPWQRSTRCGNATCVEVAFAKSERSSMGNCVEVGTGRDTGCDCDTVIAYTKASHSGPTANCVETAHAPAYVYLRDSKDQQGPILRFEHAAWTDFTDTIKAGHLDRVL